MIQCLLLMICLAGPPEPTPEINALIEQLGANKKVVRDQAQKRLEEKGYDAIRALEIAMSHKDAEVAYRARQILLAYYDLGLECDMPMIWALPRHVRFPESKDGKKQDVAADYYKMYRNAWNEKKENYTSPIQDSEWGDDRLLGIAMYKFCYDKMRSGEYTKDQMQKVITEAITLEAMANIFLCEIHYSREGPPRAIEDAETNWEGTWSCIMGLMPGM